jgi:hypothetical protein
VSSSCRVVRAAAAFFEHLDRQLPPERDPDGEPSMNDFQVSDYSRPLSEL